MYERPWRSGYPPCPSSRHMYVWARRNVTILSWLLAVTLGNIVHGVALIKSHATVIHQCRRVPSPSDEKRVIYPFCTLPQLFMFQKDHHFSRPHGAASFHINSSRTLSSTVSLMNCSSVCPLAAPPASPIVTSSSFPTQPAGLPRQIVSPRS